MRHVARNACANLSSPFITYPLIYSVSNDTRKSCEYIFRDWDLWVTVGGDI